MNRYESVNMLATSIKRLDMNRVEYGVYVDQVAGVEIPMRLKRELSYGEDMVSLNFLDTCFLWNWKRGKADVDGNMRPVNWSHVDSVLYEVDASQCAMSTQLTQRKIGLGSFLMTFSERLNVAMDVDYCTLTDASSKVFCNKHVKFARFMLLDRGTTWYQSYHYTPIYGDEEDVTNSRAYIDGTVGQFNEDLAGFIHPLHQASLDDVLAELRSEQKDLDSGLQRLQARMNKSLAEMTEKKKDEVMLAAAAKAGRSMDVDSDIGPGAPFARLRLTAADGWSSRMLGSLMKLVPLRPGGDDPAEDGVNGKLLVWPMPSTAQQEEDDATAEGKSEPTEVELTEVEPTPTVIQVTRKDARDDGRLRTRVEILMPSSNIIDILYHTSLPRTFFTSLIAMQRASDSCVIYDKQDNDTVLWEWNSEDAVGVIRQDTDVAVYLQAAIEYGRVNYAIETAERGLEDVRKDRNRYANATAVVSEYYQQNSKANLYSFLQHVTQSMFRDVHAACDLFLEFIEKGSMPVLGSKLDRMFTRDAKSKRLLEFIRFYRLETGERLQFRYASNDEGAKQLEFKVDHQLDPAT